MPRRAPLYALYAADTISPRGQRGRAARNPWYVLTTTGSATLTGLAVFFNFLPAVIAAFFGGVVVDRLGFRVASIVADLASSGAVAAIPLLHATVGIELWQLMALAFLGALLDAPGATARAALPDAVELTVRRWKEPRGSEEPFSRVPSSSALPSGASWWRPWAQRPPRIDAASFVSAALVAFLIPRARRGESEQRGRFWEELGEGLRFIRDRPSCAPSSQWCCSRTCSRRRVRSS